MKQNGAAADVWLAITSGAERVLRSLKAKAQATVGSLIKAGGSQLVSLEIPPTSISRSDKLHSMLSLFCHPVASLIAKCSLEKYV